MLLTVHPSRHIREKVLYFKDPGLPDDVPPEMGTPEQWLNVRTARLLAIGRGLLKVPVQYDPAQYSTIEMTSLSLVALNIRQPELDGFRYSRKRTGKNRREYEALTRLGTEDLQHGNSQRVEAHAIGLMFAKDMLQPDAQAALKRAVVLTPLASIGMRTHFREYTELMADGLDNKTMGEVLDRPQATVESHVSTIYHALGANRPELVLIAGGLGLFSANS